MTLDSGASCWGCRVVGPFPFLTAAIPTSAAQLTRRGPVVDPLVDPASAIQHPASSVHIHHSSPLPHLPISICFLELVCLVSALCKTKLQPFSLPSNPTLYSAGCRSTVGHRHTSSTSRSYYSYYVLLLLLLLLGFSTAALDLASLNLLLDLSRPAASLSLESPPASPSHPSRPSFSLIGIHQHPVSFSLFPPPKISPRLLPQHPSDDLADDDPILNELSELLASGIDCVPRIPRLGTSPPTSPKLLRSH